MGKNFFMFKRSPHQADEAAKAVKTRYRFLNCLVIKFNARHIIPCKPKNLKTTNSANLKEVTLCKSNGMHMLVTQDGVLPKTVLF
jgi:hypothetical protein